MKTNRCPKKENGLLLTFPRCALESDIATRPPVALLLSTSCAHVRASSADRKRYEEKASAGQKTSSSGSWSGEGPRGGVDEGSGNVVDTTIGIESPASKAVSLIIWYMMTSFPVQLAGRQKRRTTKIRPKADRGISAVFFRISINADRK